MLQVRVDLSKEVIHVSDELSDPLPPRGKGGAVEEMHGQMNRLL